MGMDFSAIIKYGGPQANDAAIRSLETQPLLELRRVKDLWRKRGFSASLEGGGWIDMLAGGAPVGRPSLPSTRGSLKTQAGFILTFTADAVAVSHPLRWQMFLTDPEWQSVMLGACSALTTWLGGDEYLVTRDESPAVLALFEGATYEEAIGRALRQEPEVSRLADLYIQVNDTGTWDSRGFLRVRPPQ